MRHVPCTSTVGAVFTSVTFTVVSSITAVFTCMRHAKCGSCSRPCARQLRAELDEAEEVERLHAVARYATTPPGGAPFPPPPTDIGEFRGVLLQDWVTRQSNLVEVP